LFYAGAVEGQMPEILSMIQVQKMTPAPAVLVVVSLFLAVDRDDVVVDDLI
jgi:solute carrier family 7 L-type amino acid transporter-like protein